MVLPALCIYECIVFPPTLHLCYNCPFKFNFKLVKHRCQQWSNFFVCVCVLLFSTFVWKRTYKQNILFLLLLSLIWITFCQLTDDILHICQCISFSKPSFTENHWGHKQQREFQNKWFFSIIGRHHKKEAFLSSTHCQSCRAFFCCKIKINFANILKNMIVKALKTSRGSIISILWAAVIIPPVRNETLQCASLCRHVWGTIIYTERLFGGIQ